MTAKTDESINKQLYILAFSLFIDNASFGIIFPLLPYLTDSLHATPIQYGLVISIYAFFQFIFAPLWGALSDRIGRKPIILSGLTGTLIGFLIFGFVDSLPLLYVSRAITGIATSATLSTANAYVADITTAEHRGSNFGVLNASLGVGITAGPAIGGLLFQFKISPHYAFLVPALFASTMALFNLVGAIFYLPESVPKKGLNNTTDVDETEILPIEFELEPPLVSISLDSFKKVLASKSAVTFILIFGLSVMSMSNFITAFSLYGSQILKLSELQLGFLFSAYGFGMALTQFLLYKKLSEKWNSEMLVLLGTALFLIGFTLIFVVNIYIGLFLVIVPLSMGYAFLNPSALELISEAIPEKLQGTGMGLNQSFASLVRIFAPIIAGYLFGIADHLPFSFSIILISLIFLIMLIVSLRSNKLSFTREQSFNIPAD